MYNFNKMWGSHFMPVCMCVHVLNGPVWWGGAAVGNSVILYQTGSEGCSLSLLPGSWASPVHSLPEILQQFCVGSEARRHIPLPQNEGVGVDRRLIYWGFFCWFNFLSFLFFFFSRFTSDWLHLKESEWIRQTDLVKFGVAINLPSEKQTQTLGTSVSS